MHLMTVSLSIDNLKKIQVMINSSIRSSFGLSPEENNIIDYHSGNLE